MLSLFTVTTQTTIMFLLLTIVQPIAAYVSPKESQALLQHPLPPKGECPCLDSKLCEPITSSRFSKELFVFHVAGEYYNYQQWRQFDWSRITTLVVWEFGISAELLCYSHLLGVRLAIPANLPQSVYASTNTTAKTEWVQNTKNEMLHSFADGINFDVEDEIDGQDIQTRAGLTDMVRRTRTALGVSYQITFDVAASPGVDNRFYDHSSLAEICDFLVIMAYDMASAIWGACLATPNSPPPMVNQGILNWLAVDGITPSKLVMALPWYGREYKCKNGTMPNARYCPIEASPWRTANCTDAGANAVSFSEMSALFKQSTGKFAGVNGDGKPTYDSILESKWINIPNVNSTSPTQVWFDDVDSLSQKYANAIQNHGLLGVGTWTANMLSYGKPPHFNNTESIPKETWEMWSAISKSTMIDTTI